MNHRENYLRNASLQGHEWIPAAVSISGASWHQEREAMEEVCLRHPAIFPGFRKGQIDFDACVRSPEQRTHTDEWGCTWEAEIDGLVGLVVGSPLEDWEAFKTWQPPRPPLLNEERRARLAQVRADGSAPAAVELGHGFFFMRLHYLRGYNNFMLDVASDEPLLHELADVLARHNEVRVRDALEAGVDMISAGDDLGTQTNSMLGPKHFRKWVFPTYKRLFGPAREAGKHVALHSDGYVMDIIDQIVESGVSIVNPQDLVNGVDAMARELKGRVCIRCDIDRQSVVPFGSPADVRELIKEEIMKLGSPQGGLEFIAGIYPPTPARNVDAMCAALEAYRTYWAGRA